MNAEEDVNFNTAILNLECNEGELTNLESTEFAVYEFPYNTDLEETEERALSLIESFVEKVASVEDTTASRQT